LIIDAALRLKARSFVIDSEAVWVGEDGVSDFAKLYDGRVWRTKARRCRSTGPPQACRERRAWKSGRPSSRRQTASPSMMTLSTGRRAIAAPIFGKSLAQFRPVRDHKYTTPLSHRR
jgi:hypothetical protein